MDFKTRCAVCSKHFCCVSHRVDHQVKNHADVFNKQRQEIIEKMLKRKAATVVSDSKSCQPSVKILNHKEQAINTDNVIENKRAVKRCHSELKDQVITTSVTVTETTRKILTPIHRVKQTHSGVVKNEIQYKGEKMEVKSLSYAEGMVKTSTPIIGNLLVRDSSQVVWDISPALLSDHQTPVSDDMSEERSIQKITPGKGLSTLTPLRGIISQSQNSKFSNRSPSINISRSRRVTFSFSSQVSSSNSPLESVQEIELSKSAGPDNQYVVNTDMSINICAEAKDLTDDYKAVYEDSSLVGQHGFFSCMTRALHSAIHTLPLFVPWRAPARRSKRSRSPDNKVLPSPIHKRPCSPWDLRKNPIRARKPISDV